MSLKSLSDYTVYAKYAHYLPEHKRRETWDEITERVFAMHARRYAKQLAESEEFRGDFEFAKEMVRQKRVLGSQRALQFGGKWIERANAKLYNCAFTYIDRPRVFAEIDYLLLCGCGVGFSVQKHHVAKLPTIKPVDGDAGHLVADSIEGWADAVDALVNSYFAGGQRVSFDYSLIRPEGALIAGQFKAPGPKGLEKALERTRALIERRLASPTFLTDEFAGKLRPIDAYDIVMYVSDSVLSGGIRRSATISLFSHDDADMMAAKTGNWFNENPQRGRSNNSVLLARDETTWEQFKAIIESTRQFGEPGFYFAASKEHGCNPCQPAWARVQIKGREGYSTIGDIKVGDEIACAEGWTKVTAKWSTGIKPIYRYKTESIGTFVGTENHRVLQRGVKVEVKDATHIDVWFNSCDSANSKVITEKIISRESLGDEEVFDLTVDNESHTYWTDGCIVSNCVEIGLFPTLKITAAIATRLMEMARIAATVGEMRSGVQFCNLTEINGKPCDTEVRFLESCRAAATLGTMQAGYTDFSYLSPETQLITEREALLGVSITGVMDNPEVLLSPKIQRAGAKVCKETNVRVAKLLGINPAARITCTKPAGSTSCVLQTASGIHPHHARRYLRRVQGNRLEFPLQHYKAINPAAVETSVWSANGTDEVISFACEVPKGAVLKNDLDAVALLSKVKSSQTNWVLEGESPELAASPGLHHNISNTVTVRADEWEKVARYIYDNREFFTGISLLAASGDLDYPQAPFATVLTPEELVREYGDGSILASGLVVDGLAAFEGNLWAACDRALGVGGLPTHIPEPIEPVKPKGNMLMTNKAFTAALADYAIQLNLYYQDLGAYRQSEARFDWVRRVVQFAARYFEGDTRRATYCLKHVSLWHTWLAIKRTHQPVDWTAVQEETQDHVRADTLGASACAGGACLV